MISGGGYPVAVQLNETFRPSMVVVFFNIDERMTIEGSTVKKVQSKKLIIKLLSGLRQKI